MSCVCIIAFVRAHASLTWPCACSRCLPVCMYACLPACMLVPVYICEVLSSVLLQGKGRQVLPSDGVVTSPASKHSSPHPHTPQDVNVYVSPLEGEGTPGVPTRTRTHTHGDAHTRSSSRPRSAHPASGGGGDRRCVCVCVSLSLSACLFPCLPLFGFPFTTALHVPCCHVFFST